jgi:ABC-type polar amino acid transport system ATPase subunit
LWPHLSGRDNIFLPWRYAAQAGRLSERELSELFGRLDLGHLINKLPAEMSGGERQRIALARAFALKPRVLLLDEPSSALDARHALDVANLINKIKQEGTVIVCATHNLGFASRISDRSIFLEDGRIITEDTWPALAKAKSEAVQSFLEVNAFQA